MSLVFFLIYISKIFNVLIENKAAVTFLSFVNDLGFIVSSTLVKEISQTLSIVASTVLYWDSINMVTYNISKTETMLFFKLHCQ